MLYDDDTVFVVVVKYLRKIRETVSCASSESIIIQSPAPSSPSDC